MSKTETDKGRRTFAAVKAGETLHYLRTDNGRTAIHETKPVALASGSVIAPTISGRLVIPIRGTDGGGESSRFRTSVTATTIIFANPEALVDHLRRLMQQASLLLMEGQHIAGKAAERAEDTDTETR